MAQLLKMLPEDVALASIEHGSAENVTLGSSKASPCSSSSVAVLSTDQPPSPSAYSSTVTSLPILLRTKSSISSMATCPQPSSRSAASW